MRYLQRNGEDKQHQEKNKINRAIINAKWRGSLEEGPHDIVEPILKALPNMTPEVTQEPPFVSRDRVHGLSSTTIGTKTSEQRVYTYGYGTPWFDVLTEQKGKITFSYDGTKKYIKVKVKYNDTGSFTHYAYDHVTEGLTGLGAWDEDSFDVTVS